MAQPFTPLNSLSLFVHLTINAVVFVHGKLQRLSPKIFLLLSAVILVIVISALELLRSQASAPAEPQPASIPNWPSPASVPPSQIGAWLAYWDEPAALKSLSLAADKIKTISPVWYHLDAQGNLMPASSTRKEQIISYLSHTAVLLVPTLNNEYPRGFDPNRVSRILNDASKSSQLINQLVNIAEKENFHGWDIDWEQINPADKNQFTDFIKQLAVALHSKGLLLSVTVHPQTGNPNDWPGSRGQDIPQLAQYADEIRIMAYDFHHPQSSPGPITPLDKLTSVLNYSTTVVPLPKLVLGLPLYGYDWSNGPGRPVQYQQALDLINSRSLTLSRDEKSQELTAKHPQNPTQGQIWFQDSESVGQKIALARKFGIFKFFFWRLGHEDPRIWTTYQNYK